MSSEDMKVKKEVQMATMKIAIGGGLGGITKDAKKTEIEARAKLLEAEVLVKKRECDLVKEKEEISITTPAGPAAVIANFGNCANYAHMAKEKGTGKVIGTGVRCHGLWFINHEETALTTAVEEDVKEILLLHRWLGHVPFESLSRLHPDAFNKVDRSKLLCDACELGKHTRSIYSNIGLRSFEPFMLIHSDVWGPCSVTSVSGFKGFVTFIDCYTRMTWIYMIKGKNEVLQCFQDFHKLVENQLNAKVRIIHTDNGKEYVNNDFGEYTSDHEIIHQTTCPGTPSQNGVAERKNRHLLEVARSNVPDECA